MDTILDVPTYIATPEKPNGNVVLYFPDVWGMSSNAQLLMDGFAEAGFLALGMDYFRGVSQPSSSSKTPSRLSIIFHSEFLTWHGGPDMSYRTQLVNIAPIKAILSQKVSTTPLGAQSTSISLWRMYPNGQTQ